MEVAELELENQLQGRETNSNKLKLFVTNHLVGKRMGTNWRFKTLILKVKIAKETDETKFEET